jgi:uncharacterized protein (TIGR02466 family)
METIPIFSSYIAVKQNLNLDINKLKMSSTLLFGDKEQYHFMGSEPDFKDLFNEIHSSFQDVWTNTLNGKDEFYPHVTDVWMNRGSAYTIVEPHQHPHQSLSGVFYINSINSKLIFINPVPQVADKIPQTADCMSVNMFNPYNSTTWAIPCETGTMVIFPAYLFHYVQNTDGNERISVAFNAEIKRKI